MPAIAWAALPSTRRETALRPATSTTGYIIRMSLVPTYGATFPLAIVETMTLGSPIGSARIAGVIRAVLPLPPMPITPANRPASNSWLRKPARASPIAVIASPRSVRDQCDRLDRRSWDDSPRRPRA